MCFRSWERQGEQDLGSGNWRSEEEEEVEGSKEEGGRN